MYRSSKHTLFYTNTSKKLEINKFLEEYHIALQEYIDFIWFNKIIVKDIVLDIQNDIFSKPSYIDYNLISSSTSLSARVLRAVADQALGIVLGVIVRKAKYLYVLEKVKEENNKKAIEFITKKLSKIKINKPVIGKNVKAELCANCVDIEQDKTSFDCFIRLSCLGKQYNHIKMPLNFNKVDIKWKGKGKLLDSILLSSNRIELRYKVEKPELKTEGQIVGADTGVKTVITLSDKQTPPESNKHGHSLDTVLTIMSRKKPGSKAFKRSEQHRKNIIGWAINRLNFSNIKEVKLEHINNIFFGKNTSKKLKRFTNSAIEQKVIQLCEELGVLVSLQNSTYKSQRCSGCGIVLKSNRKNKVYICKHCGYAEDADLNAAINNEADLPKIPYWLKEKNYNKVGFYWKPTGFYNLEGQELISP